MNKKGIVLLSGGLDSFASLDMAKNICNIELGIIFDYGQKAFEEENEAAIQISKLYNIKLEKIELPFLKKITSNALIKENNDNLTDFKNIWIPNRNGLFLNIAGCYCDKYNIDYIIIGANKEEAEHFCDNSTNFIQKANEFLEYSTQKHPKVLAPCQTYDKIQIINYMIDQCLPLNIIKSCYDSNKNTNKKHCGKCLSCLLLKEAIKKSKKPNLLKELF